MKTKTVNVNDRATIEAFYPMEAFIEDANRNAEARSHVLHGVRILSEPDRHGDFAVARGDRNVADSGPDPDTVFLTPQRAASPRAAGDQAAYEPMAQVPPETVSDAEAYRGFIDSIVETATKARFPGPFGLGQDRLKGFHGG